MKYLREIASISEAVGLLQACLIVGVVLIGTHIDCLNCTIAGIRGTRAQKYNRLMILFEK